MQPLVIGGFPMRSVKLYTTPAADQDHKYAQGAACAHFPVFQLPGTSAHAECVGGRSAKLTLQS